MTSLDQQFNQAALHWDLETLYTDLASAKGKRLTPMEKLHLRGLLCGFSPAEIAEQLGKNVKGVKTDLCVTLYRYVKSLVDKLDARIESWREVTEWLEEAGYKRQIPPEIPVDSLLTEKSVVNISNIHIDKNQLVIAFNLKIPTTSATSEAQKYSEMTENSIIAENLVN
ncbi:helix-turn-helix transcriptional regulator [Planktothrix agardhii]|uniref:helix-turn-helix transcriptional regulator n=1 Tax=Planktothrix agardhii TaxID=1160 RepID=UPI001D0A1C4E|nr:helix-turn-helix domain-containing protein [Planktothrix agardhii]MCB8758939.1 helix-turn-helix domain-containing protein [Planktothrix agardhii 1813]